MPSLRFGQKLRTSASDLGKIKNIHWSYLFKFPTILLDGLNYKSIKKKSKLNKTYMAQNSILNSIYQRDCSDFYFNPTIR